MPAFRFDSVWNSCEGLPLLRILSTLLLLCAFADFAPQAQAFALLGPLKNRTNNAPDPWQGKPYGGRPGGLGYELRGDIGGPMFLNEAYRWNVPVIYYGFDQAFVDYFGQPGIEAVESAIAILNALPPASEMSKELIEFPLNTRDINPAASSFLDLKSHVLPYLLEQMGLANPERFVWCLRWPDSDPDFPENSVVTLNYDPITHTPSTFVNEVYYNFMIFNDLGPRGSEWASAVEWYFYDPPLRPYSSVAGGSGSKDFQLGAGPNDGISLEISASEFYTGLTRDDVGGLRYLLSCSNRVWEPLLPGVTGTGHNASDYVNVAYRGGVEKITFRCLPRNEESTQFRGVTNRFLDVYYTNGVAVTQSVQRVVGHPDILFTAADLDLGFYHYNTYGNLYVPAYVERSGISQWQNHGVLNGQSGAGGPGVIHPGARIAFNRLGRIAFAHDREYLRFAPVLKQWATFADTNSPIVPHYGPLPSVDQFLVESRIAVIDGIRSVQATFQGEYGRTYRIETSTNLVDWTFWYSRENPESFFSIDHPLDGQRRFLRVTRELWPW